jgi:beta-glucanase (GH16 family)
MKNIFTIIMLLLFVQTTNAQAWELVWSDEFNYTGAPDSEKWNLEIHPSAWTNAELQSYTNRLENVRVEDSILIIEALKDNYEGSTYTSGRLNSANKGDILYGRIEIRAKLPSGLGTWPAIWMMSTDTEYGNWPYSGEMDIMEHVGFDPGKVHASTHTKDHNFNLETQKTALTDLSTFSSEYHIYGLEWTPTEIKVFIDDNYFFTSTKDASWDWQKWPFDKKFHIILNLAYGGNWGGAKGIDDAIFERTEGVRMEVDYVRLYKNISD